MTDVGGGVVVDAGPGSGEIPPPELNNGAGTGHELVGGGQFPPDTLRGRLQQLLESQGISHDAAYVEAGSFGKYEAWCQKNGYTLESAPSGALTQCTRATWKPQGQNRSAALVQHAITLMPQLGVIASPQAYERFEKPKPTRAPPPLLPPEPTAPALAPPPAAAATEAPNQGQTGAAGPVETAPRPEATPASVPEAPFPLAMPPRAQARPAQTPPAQPQTPRPAQTTIFPQGGQVRIVKLASGFEGSGITAGQRITVGTHYLEDLSRQGPVKGFLERFIVPRYGPTAGQADTTYIVERIDDRGNVIAEFPFTFAAPIAGAGGPPGPFQPQGFQAPVGYQPHPPKPGGFPEGSAEDRFITYLMEQERRSNDKYTKLEETLRKGSGGMDQMMLTMLLERFKPEPMPWERIVAQMRGIAPGLGGFDGVIGTPSPAVQPAAAAPPFDPFAAAGAAQQPLADTVGRLADRAFALAETRQREQPPAPLPQKDLTENPTFTKLLEALIHKPERNAEVEQLKDHIRRLEEKLDRPPEKSKGMAEYIADMKALKETMDFIGGGGPQVSPLVEVTGMVLENADKISGLVEQIMKLGKAPQIPKKEQKPIQQGAQQRALPGNGQPQPPPPLPDDAKLAIKALYEAPEGDEGVQPIVDAIFGLVKALGAAPPPWNALANAIGESVLQAESKPELRALITNVFVRVGAKKMLSDRLVEKISTVLHVNYSFLFSQLTGGKEKVLADAPKPEEQAGQPAPTATPPATSAATAKPAEPAQEADEDEDEEEDAETEEPSKPGAPKA